MCTPTTSLKCSCARSLTGARRWARPSTRFHRPRSRFAAMPKRWRPRAEVALSALDGMEGRAKRTGGSADFRSRRSQPQLQHRQSGAHARLSAPLSIDRGGVRIGKLVDREGDRSGRTQSGLTPGRRLQRGIAAVRTRRMGRRRLADIRRRILAPNCVSGIIVSLFVFEA